MKFTVSPDSLKTALAVISPAMSTKNAMPVLDNILLVPSSDGASFMLTMSNGDFFITTKLEVSDADGLQRALISARVLKDYVARLYSSGLFPITFVYDDGEWNLMDDFGEYRFAAERDVDAYPVYASGMNKEAFACKVPSGFLIDALSAAKGFVSNDDLRPIMTGVCLDFKPEGLDVVASDSKSLFRETLESVTSDERRMVVVPQKIASSVKALFSVGENDVISLSFDEKFISFMQGDTLLRGRVVEGRYPRYEAVIPKNNNAIAAVSMAQMNGAVDRVSVASDPTTRLVRLCFDGESSVELSSENILGDTSSRVKVPTISQDKLNGFCIGVRDNVLRACMGVFKSPTLLLTFSEPSRPIVICSESSSRIALLMPCKLAD